MKGTVTCVFRSVSISAEVEGESFSKPRTKPETATGQWIRLAIILTIEYKLQKQTLLHWLYNIQYLRFSSLFQ